MKIRGHKVTKGIIPPFSLSAISATRKAVKSFKPDVLNVHYVMPTGLAALYSQKALKVPTVITYNGRDVPGPGVPMLWKYWHQLVGKNCEDMTFVSKYCRDVIYGADSKVGHIIYNGVNESIEVPKSKRTALRNKLKLNHDSKIIFSLQRLDYLKRTDTIIECMPKILSAEKNVRLIVGGTGPDLPRLKKLAIKLNLNQAVIFVEFIPSSQLPLFFSLADLFVFHSTYETFGLVLAEAMNYKKAVVSVDNTAIKEVVDNDKNGILVPTLSPSSLSKAVLHLLKNDRKRSQMGNNGKTKVEQLFKWDLIATEYEKILKSAAFTNN
jgi:glycosyltransferase involved in cell wall biosynthesis